MVDEARGGENELESLQIDRGGGGAGRMAWPEEIAIALAGKAIEAPPVLAHEAAR